jgi:phosphopantothenate synthetase
MQVTIDKMWAELADYQPTADADGHGETWALMCSERTEDATAAASDAANAASKATYKPTVPPYPWLGILTASHAASFASDAVRAASELNWYTERAFDYMDNLNRG